MDDIIRLCTRYIIKRLLNVYCEIFGTRSYGGDALASSCVLRHMNLCQIFHNIHSITYNYHIFEQFRVRSNQSEPIVFSYKLYYTLHKLCLCGLLFLAHLSHRLMVSYCHQPMSVVRRPASTIASKDISSETAKPRALIFGM